MAARERGVDAFRFNTEDYPDRIGVTLDPTDPTTAQLSTDRGEVLVGSARGIWIRRPRWPEVTAQVTDPLDRLFAGQESVAAMGGLWRSLSERCVSPPDALQAARWKVAQLSVASAIGFRVPDTLITTSDQRAREFLASGPSVMKAVAEASVRLGEEERKGGTVEVNGTDDLSGLSAAPVLFQRRVNKVADLRVTVVGRTVFAVRIVTPDDAPLDFRDTDPLTCRYEVVSLDPEVESRLLQYLKHWPLRFGAFDFAEDAAGELWFLECNPSGQWAWLQPVTGLDITASLLDLLLDPRESAQ